MAGLKVYELGLQGTLLGTDWLVVQRGTDPAKKTTSTEINKLITGLWNSGVNKIKTKPSGTITNGESEVLTGGFGFGFGFMVSNGVNQHWFTIADDVTSTFLIGSGSGNWEWVNSGGVRMAIDSLGNVSATSFSPFTGVHIAKSNEDLKLGELVQIKSVGWVNPKQPDWVAEYCNGSKKGVYGVVYDTQLNEDEELVYLIAAVGDGFIEVDCACEYGDCLIPSETKGLATVYNGDYIPLNAVGFAGEDSEGGKISWVKE